MSARSILFAWVLLCAQVCHAQNVSISNLPNSVTAEPSDRAAVWAVVDDTVANQTRKLSLRQLGLFLEPKLTGAITAATNTLTDPVLVDRAKIGQWLVAEAWTTDAEMRLITNISGNVITVSRNWARSHAAGDAYVLSSTGERNVKWFGARGDASTNDAAAIQVALDDFDTNVLGGIESKGNNLFFPPGEYVVNGLLRLPVITPYSTSRQLVTGPNATVVTKTFNGPMWSTRWTGTHTGSSNVPTLEDNTKSWATNSLNGGYVFNLTDLTTAPPANTSLYSSATITANTGTTVTADLTADSGAGTNYGGTDRDWDNGDSYVITVPSSKWVFANLHFRDDTNGFGSVGQATLFDWSLYRSTIHDCTMSQFNELWASHDLQNDLRQYIQSPTMLNNTIDSCNYVIRASKAWNLNFSNQRTDSCNNIIHLLNIDGSACIQASVQNNKVEGGGAGTPFWVRGPHGYVQSGTYFESNNTGTEPYIRLNDGQQPRGVQISNTHIELYDGDSDEDANTVGDQKANAAYFPIALNAVSEGVSVFGNQSSGGLIDPHTQTIGTGERWHIWGNHALYGDKHNGTDSVLTRGTRVIRRIGQVQTTNATPKNMDFGGGNAGDPGPVLYASEAPFGSSFYIEVKVTAHNDTTKTETAAYWMRVVYEQGLGTPITGQFTQVTFANVIAPVEDDASWACTFAVPSSNTSVSAVNDTTNALTATGHGLTTDDIIYFQGTLPAPLVGNRTYFADVVDANTIKVRRGIGLANSIIDITNTTLSGATVRTEEVHLEVTGDATDTVNWSAEATIIICPP